MKLTTIIGFIGIGIGSVFFHLVCMAFGWTDDDKDTQAWALEKLNNILNGIGELLLLVIVAAVVRFICATFGLDFGSID